MKYFFHFGYFCSLLGLSRYKESPRGGQWLPLTRFGKLLGRSANFIAYSLENTTHFSSSGSCALAGCQIPQCSRFTFGGVIGQRSAASPHEVTIISALSSSISMIFELCAEVSMPTSCNALTALEFSPCASA